MTAAPSIQLQRLRVGIQGEAGSFSHAALRRLLGTEAEPMFCGSFARAVDSLAAGESDQLLLPVWNSLAGVVRESLDAIASHDLHVEREWELPIRLVCAALPGTRLENLTQLWSHPVALRQCKRFLARHPALDAREVHDTAGAARLLAEARDPRVAVATSDEAAEAHGLTILEHDIHDRADNRTRFWLLARQREAPSGTAGRVEAHFAESGTATALSGIRGAISVDADTDEAIIAATTELLPALLDANAIPLDSVVSAVFTLTPDLTAHFPANAARSLGWHAVPMLCAAEIDVPGALPRCLRVLLHVHRPEARWTPTHLYLREARSLRPDLDINTVGAAG